MEIELVIVGIGSVEDEAVAGAAFIEEVVERCGNISNGLRLGVDNTVDRGIGIDRQAVFLAIAVAFGIVIIAERDTVIGSIG